MMRLVRIRWLDLRIACRTAAKLRWVNEAKAMIWLNVLAGGRQDETG